MYAAKLDGEGAAMYDAVVAWKDAMVKLKVIIDGGKNTLSMATQVGRETLKDPDNLIISTYVTCLNITKTITLDLTIC
jgi:phosphoribosylformylglycinamidine synthase